MHITEALLSATEETELAQAVEVGLYATHLLRHRGTNGVVLALASTRSVGASLPEALLLDLEREGQLAWHRLLLANTGLVKLLARRYCRSDPDLMDELVQEGFVALAEGLRRYDWGRGVRLSTHLWHWIKHHLSATMRGHSHWEATITAAPADDFPLAAPTVEDESPVPGLLAELAPVERQVLLARAGGAPLQQIADSLGLSRSTVRRIERQAQSKGRQAQLAA